jgi:hypothetical protein
MGTRIGDLVEGPRYGGAMLVHASHILERLSRSASIASEWSRRLSWKPTSMEVNAYGVTLVWRKHTDWVALMFDGEGVYATGSFVANLANPRIHAFDQADTLLRALWRSSA